MASLDPPVSRSTAPEGSRSASCGPSNAWGAASAEIQEFLQDGWFEERLVLNYLRLSSFFLWSFNFLFFLKLFLSTFGRGLRLWAFARILGPFSQSSVIRREASSPWAAELPPLSSSAGPVSSRKSSRDPNEKLETPSKRQNTIQNICKSMLEVINIYTKPMESIQKLPHFKTHDKQIKGLHLSPQIHQNLKP